MQQRLIVFYVWSGCSCCPCTRPAPARQTRVADACYRHASPTATLRRVAAHSCSAIGPATTACGGVRRIRLTLPSLRPGRYIHVSAFGRFDETTCLVEKTSALTLPDFVRCDILSQVRFRRHNCGGSYNAIIALHMGLGRKALPTFTTDLESNWLRGVLF